MEVRAAGLFFPISRHIGVALRAGQRPHAFAFSRASLTLCVQLSEEAATAAKGGEAPEAGSGARKRKSRELKQVRVRFSVEPRAQLPPPPSGAVAPHASNPAPPLLAILAVEWLERCRGRRRSGGRGMRQRLASAPEREEKPLWRAGRARAG